MHTHHNLRIRDEKLRASKDMFMRPAKSVSGLCNLCQKQSERLKSHVARHLQQMALFALPRDNQTEGSGKAELDEHSSRLGHSRRVSSEGPADEDDETSLAVISGRTHDEEFAGSEQDEFIEASEFDPLQGADVLDSFPEINWDSVTDKFSKAREALYSDRPHSSIPNAARLTSSAQLHSIGIIGARAMDVKARSSPIKSSDHHWTVSRSANPLFTGREDVLQELGAILSRAVVNPPHQVQCRIVVLGMGGQGKSEICLQLAHRFRQKYVDKTGSSGRQLTRAHRFWGVFWIDVSITTSAERSFLDLARTLSLPARTWEEACRGIANLKQPWLLVLDDANDPHVDYQRYIPNSPWGVVILTSRNEGCQQYATAKATSLEALSADAARDLLLKAACVPVSQHSVLSEDAARVAALLQSHPLALIQAGAYVSRGHCQLNQYPAVYERQRQRLLQFRPTQARSRYGDVYATFEASADALKQLPTMLARDALQLLPLLAVCGTSRLPLTVFEAGWEGSKAVASDVDDDADDAEVKLLTPWHVAYLPSFLDVSSPAWDSFRLVEAVQLLKAFALVTADLSSGWTSVSMHPLVHAWARDRQVSGEQHENWLSMGCVVAFAHQGGAVNRADERLLQGHVESLTGWEVSTMFAAAPPSLVARVLVHCGWLLLRMRSDAKLFLLIQTLMNWLGLDEMTVEQEWLGFYDLASRSFHNHGKPKKAIQLMEQVVAIRKESLPADHPDRLASQHVLAEAYQADGKVMEAVALLEEVVKIQEQSLALDYPDRLTSQHALAEAYKANGQVNEAVVLLEEVVKIQEQTLTADHPSRLASQRELARAYRVNGHVTKAVALLEEVVKIQEQTLAADHPSRLASQRELARAYQRMDM